MRASSFLRLPLLTLVIGGLLGAGACQHSKAPPDDDFSSFAGADIKSDSFSKRMKIVGNLVYGQTSGVVAYSKTPRYRAFTFQGGAGDAIDVRIHSADGDAVGWVLDKKFQVLAVNDDSDGGTDSHLQVTLPDDLASSYYIVFREYSQAKAHFTVTLNGPGGATVDMGSTSTPDLSSPPAPRDMASAPRDLATAPRDLATAPRDMATAPRDMATAPRDMATAPQVSSLWDDALATGTPITAAQATARFAPGTTLAQVGSFGIQERVRTCNATTGCADWIYPSDVSFAYSTYELWNPGPGWSDQKSCFQFGSASFPSVSGQLALVVGTGGRIDLQLASSATGTVACSDVTSGHAACGNLSSTGFGGGLTRGPSCNLPNPAGGGSDPTVYPASVTLYDTTKTDGSPLSLSVLVTADHVYARASTQSAQAQDGSYRVVEYALYGSLTGGAVPPPPHGCTKTTCAQQGKSCGAISDGCGGTLSCGSCGYPYVCGSDNTCQVPPGCNLQPCYTGASVAYTCCGSGQVTCSNGTGCTCYDACY